MPGQLHSRHANPTGGRVHQQPLARTDAREVRQRVIGGEEYRGYRRCLCVRTIPEGMRCDHPMIRDDHRSRAEEHAHHTIAWGEPDHILGDLKHDAGTFAADVGSRVGV